MRRRNSGCCDRWMIWRISSLPGWSFGCALPAKMNCTGRSAIVEDARQALRVAQEQVRPLVGGEAAREADRQRLGIEHLVGVGDLRPVDAPPLQLRLQPAAREAHQTLAQALVAAPQLGVGNARHALPDQSGSSGPRTSAGRGSGRRAARSRSSSTTAVWIAVGDVGDRDLAPRARRARCARHIARETSPCSSLTPLANVREPQRQHRHAERLHAVAGVLPAEGEELVRVEPEIARHRSEVVHASCRAGRRRCRPARACAS